MRWRLVLLIVAGVLMGAGLSLFTGSAALWNPPGGSAVAAPTATPALTPSPVPTRAPAPTRAPPTTRAPVPTSAPTPEPPPEPPPVDPALVARIDGALEDVRLGGFALGIAVVDDAGALQYARNADHAVLPASTQKLVVAAAALATFGPDHRFVTRAGAGGPPSPGGTITGDLYLVGGGDPTLVSPDFSARIMPQRPSTQLAGLVAKIAEAGVKRVTGDIVGDPSYLPDDPLPSGWRERYLWDLDGSRSSGLTIDAGRQLTERDGRLLGSAADDPALEAARQLKGLLERRGIEVAGEARVQRDSAPAVQLAAVVGPSLQDILREMVQQSDNHLAEAIHRAVGAAGGDGTYAGAAQVTTEVLADLGLDWDDAVIADGSGLSRDNRLTAALLAGLDAGMHRSTTAAQWDDLMAVTGESGTLRRRLVGTLADGRIRGKTGYLGDVRAFAGSAVGPGGRRLHVAVVGNNLDGRGHQTVRTVTDGVLLALVEHLYGCVHVPVPTSAPTALEDSEADAPEQLTELVCSGA